MRKPSSNIHELICSLTKGEKKRVTIHLKGLGKKGEEHLRLFKTIGKQEVYNEDVLRKSFRGVLLSNAKKRLGDLILEVLVQLNNEADIHHQLMTGLQRYQVYFKKGLYRQAQEEIFRQKKLAQKHEMFNYLQLIYQRIIEFEFRVNHFKNYSGPALVAFLDELKQCQEQGGNLFNYVLLQIQLYRIFYKKDIPDDGFMVLDEVAESLLLSDLNQAKSVTAKLTFFNLWMMINNGKGNLTKTLDYSLKGIALFEDNYETIHVTKEYIIHLLNALANAVGEQEPKIVEVLLAKIKKNKLLVEKNDVYRLLVMEFTAEWFDKSGNVKEGKRLIEESKAWLEHCTLKPVVIYFRFASISFLAQNYEQALDFLEIPINQNADGKYQILQKFGKYFKLLIYFEIGQFSLLESLNRSLYRKLDRSSKTYHLEYEIIKYFRKLLKSPPSEYNTIFKEMYHQLQIVEEEERDVNVLLHICNLFEWVESKATQKPLIDILHDNIWRNEGT